MAAKFFRQLSQDPDQSRAHNLELWASSLPGVTLIKDALPRQRCRVAGVIKNIRIDPREGRRWVEATLIDGTGRIVAKWLGRPAMSGITLGMGLIIEGIAGESDSGTLVVLNPEYQLVPSPEHG
ncbi:MAG: OB-fold nucleic acid binding domain-containing protein [Actinomycetota bacterium]